MEFLKVLILALAILVISGVFLAFNIIFRKAGKFPNTHVSGNKYLKREGVHCSQTQDKLEQRNAYREIKFKNLIYIPEKK
jgi:hypothetical protein